jgi:hypothetical protein
MQRAAGPRRVIDCEDIIMSELDQDEVTGVHFLERRGRASLVQKSPGAATTQCGIDHVDLGGIEEPLERSAQPWMVGLLLSAAVESPII